MRLGIAMPCSRRVLHLRTRLRPWLRAPLARRRVLTFAARAPQWKHNDCGVAPAGELRNLSLAVEIDA